MYRRYGTQAWLAKLLLLKIYNIERGISMLGEGYFENVLNP